MILVDAILKPADTYWKKQYNAERIRRQRAEADAKCYKDEADYNHESLAIVSDRELKQARAIEAYNKEVAELKQRLKERETELTMTRRQEHRRKGNKLTVRLDDSLFDQLCAMFNRTAFASMQDMVEAAIIDFVNRRRA